MITQFSIPLLPEEIPQDYLSALTLTPIPSAWTDSSEPSLFSAAIVRQAHRLIFIASGNFTPTLAPQDTGEFNEGLWKGDVAELFVSLEGDEYLELNLSPNAAWWGCLFSKYRLRKKELSSHDGVAFAVSTTQLWRTVLIITHEQLVAATLNRKFNITAIRHSPAPQYYSLYRPPEHSSPDFHLPELRELVPKLDTTTIGIRY